MQCFYFFLFYILQLIIIGIAPNKDFVNCGKTIIILLLMLDITKIFAYLTKKCDTFLFTFFLPYMKYQKDFANC